MRSRRVHLLLLVVPAVVALALVGIIVADINDSASAEGVSVSENGAAVALDLSQEDAIAEASRRAGFPVKAPKKLPDSRLQLTNISVQLTPTQIPNPFNTATLKWSPRDKAGQASSYYLEIVQIRHRIGAPDDRARQIPTTQPDVEVWVETNDYGAHTYTALFADRTYLVVIYGASDGPAESAVLESILSLK